MLDTRERAYAERVPQADAVLALGPARQIRRAIAPMPAGSSTRWSRARMRRARHRRGARPVGAHRAPRSGAAHRAQRRRNERDPREDAARQGRAVLAARRVLQGARVERTPHAQGSRPGAARSAEPLGARAEGAQLHAQQHRRVRRARRGAAPAPRSHAACASRASRSSRTACSNRWRAPSSNSRRSASARTRSRRASRSRPSTTAPRSAAAT